MEYHSSVNQTSLLETERSDESILAEVTGGNDTIVVKPHQVSLVTRNSCSVGWTINQSIGDVVRVSLNFTDSWDKAIKELLLLLSSAIPLIAGIFVEASSSGNGESLEKSLQQFSFTKPILSGGTIGTVLLLFYHHKKLFKFLKKIFRFIFFCCIRETTVSVAFSGPNSDEFTAEMMTCRIGCPFEPNEFATKVFDAQQQHFQSAVALNGSLSQKPIVVGNDLSKRVLLTQSYRNATLTMTQTTIEVEASDNCCAPVMFARHLLSDVGKISVHPRQRFENATFVIAVALLLLAVGTIVYVASSSSPVSTGFYELVAGIGCALLFLAVVLRGCCSMQEIAVYSRSNADLVPVVFTAESSDDAAAVIDELRRSQRVVG